MRRFLHTTRGRIGGRAAVLAGVAAAAVVAVGGISWALTSGTGSATSVGGGSPTASTPGGTEAAGPAGGGTPGAAGSGTAGSGRARAGWGTGLGADLRRAVHAEVVVPATNGGYHTIDLDRGVVTAVSATSITIQRADGVSVTASLTSSTRQPRGAPQSGEEVLVVSSGGDALLVRPLGRAGSPATSAAG